MALLSCGRRYQRVVTSVGTAGAVLALATAAAAQDMVRVRQTIQRLSSPAFHGRGYVHQGDHIAADYLRAQFSASGLQPLSTNYTQAFPLPINTFPGRASLQVGSQRLTPGIDFIADPSSGTGHVKGNILAFDTLLFSHPERHSAFLATDLCRRVLVLRQHDAARLSQLPVALQAHVLTAAARVTLLPSKLTASLASKQDPQPHLQVLASKWPAKARTVIVHLDAVFQPAYPTQNVIGYLPGRTQPDSFLVVTAHYDHLGRLGRSTYFPGANDNASGVAMLLELARHFSQPQNRPDYSLVFIGFGAEEAGLVGSRYFVEHPLFPLERIHFLVNLDLVGTGSQGATVVNGKIFEPQFQLLTQLNSAGHYLPSLVARGRAANSDHYFFSEHGVPSFFLYTRGGPTAYHDVQDQADALPLTAFQQVFALLSEFLLHL
ncbi:M28 family metallopeptidase [Hymenobacter mucosus]|uniref:Peptidase family M28 n=1 Tax=Hymenobacter mucosus TaxID=1411120 RepID=A0A238X9M4_9BACT|nr:M20/M25/M40 family metallo-hydrolase [Hymenobacter mucosus]SNR55054.1 Peptidase family M28 [Hymenobacter mucosus]